MSYTKAPALDKKANCKLIVYVVGSRTGFDLLFTRLSFPLLVWPKTFSNNYLAHEGCWPNIPSSKMDDHISLSLFSSFPILDPQKLIELTQFIYQLTSGLNFGNWWYTLALIVSMWLVMLLQNYQRILIKQTFQCSAKHQPLIFIVSLVTL